MPRPEKEHDGAIGHSETLPGVEVDAVCQLAYNTLPVDILQEAVMATTEELVKVLGGPVVLRHRVRSIDDLDRLVQKGLPYQALERVMKRFGLELVEAQRVLLMPPRTLARRKERARMRASESDRLIRLARIGAHAAQVLGTDEKAATWLHRPNRALNNKAPLELLQTDLGVNQVDAVLNRIEHGVIG